MIENNTCEFRGRINNKPVTIRISGSDTNPANVEDLNKVFNFLKTMADKTVEVTFDSPEVTKM